MKNSVRCAECDILISNESKSARKPCPQCGSMSRNFSVSIHERLVIDDHLMARGKSAEKTASGRRKREFWSGHDIFRQTGEWRTLERDIDRENNRYRERITELKTGNIIREVDEALSDHRGRGNAKSRTSD